MNEFIAFARAHGLLLESVVADRWVRVRTEDHPKKKNGSYKFLRTVGWVQNFATMQAPAEWRSGTEADAPQIDHAAVAASMERERRRIAEGRVRAAKQAQELIAKGRNAEHAYLAAKGFPEERGIVIDRDGQTVLVVPMHAGGAVVGCQLIGEDGQKRFLPGQQSKGATFTIGSGPPIWCEGFATALSVRAALRKATLKASVVACFSANNLQQLAQRGVVIADNDASATGQRAAEATGLPYWMSSETGEDFNDYHQRVGLFRASQDLKRLLMRRPP